MQQFYSNGKFLITGEYLVTKGAKALAIPLQFGQSLDVQISSNEPILEWQSFEKENSWFEGRFQLSDFEIITSSSPEIGQNLKAILTAIRQQNPSFLQDNKGVKVISKSNFTMTWGLGSSSTLINNLADWSAVNPYILLENTFGGSGYDIACAKHQHPIFYTKKSIEDIAVTEVSFSPSFQEQLFFVYLGKKMNSRSGMAHFDKHAQYDSQIIQRINSIGEELVACEELSNFESLLVEHEQIISRIIGLERTQDALFSDYPHVIKSLGAWGGDFVLVTGKNLEEVKNYFYAKNLTTIFPYKDIVLNP